MQILLNVTIKVTIKSINDDGDNDDEDKYFQHTATVALNYAKSGKTSSKKIKSKTL